MTINPLTVPVLTDEQYRYLIEMSRRIHMSKFRDWDNERKCWGSPRPQLPPLSAEEDNSLRLYELQRMHTRVLMGMIRAANRSPYGPSHCGGDDGEESYPYELIKHVLDKREHVPNKQEARALRQARAKRGSTRQAFVR